MFVTSIVLNYQWADLCKAYLQEAKWYYAGYTPTVEEYLENAWVSMSVPVMLMHAYAGVTNPMNKEAMDVLDTHDIVRCSSYIQRFANDLGTSPVSLEILCMLYTIKEYSSS